MENRTEQLNSRGLQYLNQRDYVSAIKYFTEAVRIDGNLNATYNLGYCYFHGYGVSKNYEQALRYFSIFDELHDNIANNAMYLSGVIYDNGGYGVQSNKQIAKKYYRKAANNGHAWSLLQFGRLVQLEGDYQSAKRFIQDAMKNAANDYELQKVGKRLLAANRIGRFSNFL